MVLHNIFNPSRSGEETSDFIEELLSALDHIFLSVVKLDLNTGTARLLQSLGQQERKCYDFQWEKYLNFYQAVLEPEDAQKLSVHLSAAQLRTLSSQESRQYSLNLACRHETGLDSLEIIVQFESENRGNNAYIFTRQSGDNLLLRRIIDLYVYNNCDYFIYLDAKNNSYTMFSGSKSGTPLPPSVCDDYSSELVKYANAFVIPEDRERVIYEMNLDRVTAALEDHEVHSFTCGVWQEGVGYTHKRLEYRYYNRSQKMILLSRSDITEIYNEQQRHARELENALERALTDPLTGLLNYQGIQEAVKRELTHSHHMAAMLFLDLDDFKSVNDTYGHAAGDLALQTAADILRQNIRSTDYAARIGGDEFVIFLSCIQHRTDAANCARRICQQLPQAQVDDFHLSCSIGISFAPDDGISYTDLAKKADQKVYQAKSSGKNQFAL